ncbi:MAG: DUF222 domain-containing protein [Dermatophilaceae bacterium]|nr:HNH endonuclease [Intrasporangiaceae bacterium]
MATPLPLMLPQTDPPDGGARTPPPGPLAPLVQSLTEMTASVRALAPAVSAASTDGEVRIADLTAVVAMVNQLGRASAGIEAMALAAFARRDEVTDPADPFAEPRPEQVRGLGFVHDDAGLEVAHVLGVSEGSGCTRVDRAAELTSRMPLTLAAVTEGRIEMWQAHHVLEECRLLDDEQARLVDEWLAGRLGRIEPTRLRAATRYAIGRIDPERVRRRAAKARKDRTLEIIPASDPGLSQVYALIPSHHAAAIWEAASALATEYQTLDPGLTADQARADAFVDLVLSEVDVRAHVTLGLPVVTGAASAVGEAHERRPDPTEGKAPEDFTPEDIDYLFGPERDAPRSGHGPASTDPPHTTPAAGPPDTGHETCAPDPGYDGPGTAPDRIPDWMLDPSVSAEPGAPIHGTGPLAGAFTSGVTIPKVGHIPGDVIARLLERLDLTISRALIDAADGTVLETVADAYSPPRSMRGFVVVRDGQCRMYGCTRSAERCDLDHAVPHDQGGPTSPANLAGLCRHHHRAKQSRRWIYHFDPETGIATWINTRTGTIRATQPATSLAANAMHRRTTRQPEPQLTAEAEPTRPDPEPPPF